jgi:hypothetical protein
MSSFTGVALARETSLNFQWKERNAHCRDKLSVRIIQPICLLKNCVTCDEKLVIESETQSRCCFLCTLQIHEFCCCTR